MRSGIFIMPVNPRSEKNLRPGSAKKEPRNRLQGYVLDSTQSSIAACSLSVGEAIDIAEFVRGNMSAIASQEIKLGLIRLVNPWRGRIWCADLATAHGTLSARTGAKPKNAFERWDIYLVRDGVEYWCGRSFTKRELMRWFSAEVLPADNQPQDDEFGSIPANTPNPQSWEWYGFTVREVVLPSQYKPTVADLQRLAGFALAMRPNEFSPYLDLFEVWVCDKDTLEPLALVATGSTLEEAEQQTFSPLVRLGTGDLSFEFKDCEKARSLQKQINERVNAAVESGCVKYASRLFERRLDSAVVEYRGGHVYSGDDAIANLPENWLADPWWGELQCLR